MADNTTEQTDNSERNQRLFLLVFLALIAYTFSELWRFYADNAKKVGVNTELVEQLHSPETAMINTSKVRASNPSGEPLATVATVTAAKQNIQFERFEPISEEQVKVWVEDISYEQLVQWVNELEFVEGVSAISLNIERGNAQGTISGQVELARAAP